MQFAILKKDPLLTFFFFDMTVDFKAKMAIKQSEDTGQSDLAG